VAVKLECRYLYKARRRPHSQRVTDKHTHWYAYVSSSNIKRTTFSSTKIPMQNDMTLLVVRERTLITVITYHCVSFSFLSIVITSIEQVFPSVVAQCISLNL